MIALAQRLLSLVVVLFALIFTPSLFATEPASLKTFTLRLSGEPETLDWNLAHTMIETYLLMNLMEGLVTLESGYEVKPSLAEKWHISQDGKTYTFYLKKNVKWSDGKSLTAADFVYSWKRLLSPVTAASYAYLLFDIVGAEDFNKGKNKDFNQVGIKALDEHTFQVQLKSPISHWIFIPSFWVTFPLREDIVQKHGTSWARPGRMVTAGPFTLISHDIDSKIVMKENPFYHGKKGNVQQVVALIVKDDTTAMNLYQAGKLDFLTDISTLDLKRLESRPDLKTFPYLKIGYLGFTVNKFPLNSVHVRKAIAYAIDKSKLGSVLHGGQKSATTFVPAPLLGFNPNLGLKYDPAQAKKELKQSGFDLSRPIQFDILTPNWDKQLLLAQFIQSELKKNLGLEAVIQPFDHKTFRAQLDIHAYASFEGSWGADYPDPDNFLSVFLSDSGNNRTTWKNSSYDRLILEARTLMNSKQREKKYLEAQKILLEQEVVLVPLYYEPNKALVRSRVSGVELNPLNYLLLRKVNVES